MKIIYHHVFTNVYDSDPAAAPGRMEAIMKVLAEQEWLEFLEAKATSREDIAALHTDFHISQVVREGLYEIAALAAGGAIQAAEIGLSEPCLALVRPPGHHASANKSWGFCHFNNIAIAISALLRRRRIRRAMILDIDLHFGDGTVNLLGNFSNIFICNPDAERRANYLAQVEGFLKSQTGIDIIGISAGFDNHHADWGGLLETSDYRRIGALVKKTATTNGGGCFAVLEGGYNHRVLGENVLALLTGLAEGQGGVGAPKR